MQTSNGLTRRNFCHAGLTLLALSVVLSFCSSASAGWTLVYSGGGFNVYRDTETGLEWTTTLGSSGNDHGMARNLVNNVGFRLPTWHELRYVVNNNNGIYQLNLRQGLLDLYETDNPSVLAGAYGGSISTKRPRQAITQTWVVGVR